MNMLHQKMLKLNKTIELIPSLCLTFPLKSNKKKKKNSTDDRFIWSEYLKQYNTTPTNLLHLTNTQISSKTQK